MALKCWLPEHEQPFELHFPFNCIYLLQASWSPPDSEHRACIVSETAQHTTIPIMMRRTVSAPAWVRVSPTTSCYSYPQIRSYQDPARIRQGPLVVTNPDPGSEAEKVRDETLRGLETGGEPNNGEQP